MGSRGTRCIERTPARASCAGAVTGKPPCDRPDECRITAEASMSTCVTYPPVVDGYGRNHNQDRNLTYSSQSCATCGRKWQEVNGRLAVTAASHHPV